MCKRDHYPKPESMPYMRCSCGDGIGERGWGGRGGKVTEAAKSTFEGWVGGGHDVDELSVIGKFCGEGG